MQSVPYQFAICWSASRDILSRISHGSLCGALASSSSQRILDAAGPIDVGRNGTKRMARPFSTLPFQVHGTNRCGQPPLSWLNIPRLLPSA